MKSIFPFQGSLLKQTALFQFRVKECGVLNDKYNSLASINIDIYIYIYMLKI